TNIAVLGPGLSFREVSQRCWKIPKAYVSQRYPSLMHGVGLADEYPSIKHWVDFEAKAYEGVLQPGMVLCVESFIGVEGGREGVKLEEQVIITETGTERMSSYPFEVDWL
ncbi:MAG TPA: M24 family metallopeptidase, partial [Gammaproteobacteria bacterium]|nr:M24 family metallopeptidase [Gammaproteobacteria bacterium]